MKALLNNKYGQPSILEIKDIEQPQPKDDEVLIKNYASSLNSYDWDLVRGKPLIYRFFMGIGKPRYPVPGVDVSGIIVSVGKNVKKLKPGDEVFGDVSNTGFGAFAQYVCAHHEMVALKPKELSFDTAAGIPHSGLLALQSLQHYGEVTYVTKILVNGAGGCVGPIIIQMAKLRGAEVTAVDSTEKIELLLSYGADAAIDYKTEDFAHSGKKYDLIIDLVAQRSVFDYNRCLNPKGVLAVVGGKPKWLIQIGLIGALLSKKTGKKLGLVIHKPNIADFNYLASLFASGKIKPVIDSYCSLKEVPHALQKLGEGKLLGKVIVKIDHDTNESI